MSELAKIYKSSQGEYWIEGMCETVRGLCQECCEGCSVYRAMQAVAQELQALRAEKTKEELCGSTKSKSK